MLLGGSVLTILDQIVVLAKGDIKKVSDLKGKKVSFGSVGSTSQHLGPAQALTDLGIAYNKDYSAIIIKRNVAVEALIRGDLAAIGMNFGHLEKARKAYPKVAFTVLARGRDLPNDVLVAKKNISDKVFNAVKKAFIENGEDIMAAVLKGDDNAKYKGGFFLATVNDADYDYVRSMYRTIGVNGFGKFVGN